jgi:AraC family transcriptional regulator, L-rhamnose operon transcriptional activator RhaR
MTTSTKLKSAAARLGSGPPARQPLSWKSYHQAVRRIVAKWNPNHGNYGVHDHEFVEIAVIAAGTCRHQTVLGEFQPTAGDVYLFRPGAWHGYADVQGLSLYNCCFDTALLGRELGWMADEPYLGNLLWALPLSPRQRGMVALRLPSAEFAACRRLLDDLCDLARIEHQSHFGDHVGLLIQILSLLARNTPRPSTTSAGNVRAQRAVALALKCIDDAPADDWTLPLLASRAAVEATYFSRLFRAAVGLPPMAYLTRRRLEVATTLLRRNDLAIGDVGAMAGWPDANYFSRSFRRHFGMTPSRYRQRFREGEKRS